jgi:ferredoxin
MKPEVDRDTCIGAGVCVGVAPAVFELDDEGKSQVIDPNGADAAVLHEAAEGCPMQAISLFDDEGNQVYP